MPPLYSFSNPSNPDETIDIIMSMNESHFFEKDGEQWDRVWHKPQAKVDSISAADPFSEKDFVNKTNNKKLNNGDCWDAASEASEKRIKSAGFDETKEKFYKKQQAKRGGKKCDAQIKEEIKNMTFEV